MCMWTCACEHLRLLSGITLDHYCIHWDRVSPQSNPELASLARQPALGSLFSAFQGWNYTTHLCEFWGSEHQSPGLCGKCSNHWAISVNFGVRCLFYLWFFLNFVILLYNIVLAQMYICTCYIWTIHTWWVFMIYKLLLSKLVIKQEKVEW